jgi:hypothetical protein
MQEREEFRGLRRKIKMSREGKVKRKICVWKRKKEKYMCIKKKKKKKKREEEWQERYDRDESSE